MATNYLRHIAASLALSLFTAIPVHADILSLGFLSGFTANQADADSAPTILSNGVVQLTHSSAGEVRSLIDDTKQSIDQFTADFTYQTNQQPLSTDGGFGRRWSWKTMARTSSPQITKEFIPRLD